MKHSSSKDDKHSKDDKIEEREERKESVLGFLRI